MACKISELGAVIAAEIGSTETPADSNKTKYGKWYGQDGQPWCDMFQAWCANQVGATDICGKFAYTPYHANFFKNKGAWYTTPKKGDYAFFHNGKRICHIGWVEKVIDSNTVQTIEGNTGSGSNADGGQVQRRKRSISGTPKWKIVGFGRPEYLDEVSTGESGNAAPKVRKHIVQEGETLFLIGKQYGVNEEEMKKENPGIDAKNLEIGSTVNIPIDARELGNATPKVRKHIVQEDETLFLIGKQYGVNEEEMKKANPGIDAKNLEIGSTVNIPIDAREPGNATPKVRKHIVQEGETLFLIGKQYGVNEEEMKKANPGIDAKNLEIGSTVNIPIDAREPSNNPASAFLYRVHHYRNRNDTIEAIARKFKIKQATIKDANPGINNKPSEGTIIVIPTASIPISSEHVVITSIHHKVWNFFINEGFSATATAGIMGNLQQESRMKPTTYQDRGGPGRGIGQWETPGRWDKLKSSAHGREWDLQFQLEYILKDLKGETGWVGATFLNAFGGYESLKKMSIYQAVIAFECSFELAGDPGFLDRFAFANSIYRSLASNVGE
ncbi:phage tail tip lysozyme [Bacillus thuringiensis]|uniref:phage tail tip lysozyme n=1 Tax=Bacillus thuringiensis TaxID=1428 RepID=UPI000BFD4144|nr:phage tail tip lysozyme [Bacillus thuringiensis]PGH91543.1 hypothetical protein CN898_28565 [Bacillus thuringiensis]